MGWDILRRVAFKLNFDDLLGKLARVNSHQPSRPEEVGLLFGYEKWPMVNHQYGEAALVSVSLIANVLNFSNIHLGAKKIRVENSDA